MMHPPPNLPPMPARSLVACALAALLLVGCQPKEKVVNYKPFFTGLEGMKTQTAPVSEAPAALPGAAVAPTA